MKVTFSEANLPTTDIYFFRQRLKNKIFQSALAYFASVAKERNMTKKDIAKLLNKDPAQITRWFSGPNNWTLDTISDLLLAMGAEMKHEIVPLHELKQEPIVLGNTMALSVKAGAPRVESRIDSALSSTKTKIPLQYSINADIERQESCQQISLESGTQADRNHFSALLCTTDQRKHTLSNLPL